MSTPNVEGVINLSATDHMLHHCNFVMKILLEVKK